MKYFTMDDETALVYEWLFKHHSEFCQEGRVSAKTVPVGPETTPEIHLAEQIEGLVNERNPMAFADELADDSNATNAADVAEDGDGWPEDSWLYSAILERRLAGEGGINYMRIATAIIEGIEPTGDV